MRIIIAGAGEAGVHLAKSLSAEKFDVVINLFAHILAAIVSKLYSIVNSRRNTQKKTMF